MSFTAQLSGNCVGGKIKDKHRWIKIYQVYFGKYTTLLAHAIFHVKPQKFQLPRASGMMGFTYYIMGNIVGLKNVEEM